jgi:threonine dehydratase
VTGPPLEPLGITRAEIEAAVDLVRPTVPLTPCVNWPQITALAGCDVWVKHENHTPIGAFKVRGGLVYMDALVRGGAHVSGVVTGTRGNHGQSVALAAAQYGLRATVVVPRGNSLEKNAAMRAYGATVIEHGADFQAALEHATELARQRGWHFVPAFDRRLVVGVATYAWELFLQQPDLARVYVPIGLGSGICGVAAARAALDRDIEIVGVVADAAPAYFLSFAAGEPREAAVGPTIADGVACRTPNPEALAAIRQSVARIVRVGEADIRTAMRAYYTMTHNLAEGAGALALAALLADRPDRGRKVGVVLSGSNVDWPVLQRALAAPELATSG